MTKEPSTDRRWKPNSSVVTIIAFILVCAALEVLGLMPNRETRQNILGGLAIVALAGIGVTWLVSVLSSRRNPADGQSDHTDAT